jgi:hypothetical protein
VLALARPALADPERALDCLTIETGVSADDPAMVWIANACASQIDYVTRFVEQGTRNEWYSMNYALPGDHAVDWSFGDGPPVLVAACYNGAADCDIDHHINIVVKTLNDEVPPGACLQPCDGFDAAANEAWLVRRAELEAELPR